MPQIAFKLDRVTLENIIKGATHAALVSGAVAATLAGLDFVKHAQIADPATAAFVSWIAQTAYNAVKEWSKGVPATEATQ